MWYAPGYLLLRVLRHREADPTADHLLAFGLGMGIWIYLIFLLSACGFLYSAVVYGLMAAFFILFLILLAKDKWPLAKSKPFRFPRLQPAKLCLLSALTLLLIVLFLHALLPEPATDAQVYHLLVPRLTIEHHGWRPIAYNVYSHWPMNVEQLFTMAMILKDYRLATLVHFWFGIMTLWLLWLLCRRAGQPRFGILAVVFFLLNPTVRTSFEIAYIDFGCAFFMLASFWFLAKGLSDTEARRRNLLFAGLFGGVLAGCKLNGFMGGLCLGLLYLVARRGEKRLLKDFGEMLVFFGLPAVLLLMPWLIKSAVETGNPVYPVLFNYLGGVEWDSKLSTQLYQWHQSIGMGRGWRDYLLLPLRIFLKSGGGYERFGAPLARSWVFLVPLSLTAFNRRPMVRWALLVSAFYFVLWSMVSQQTRFLMPILPLLALAEAVAVGDLVERLQTKKSRRWTEFAILAGAAVWILVFALTNVKLLGRHDQNYLQRLESDPTPAVFRYVNRHLPQNARLLLLNANQGFFCRREYIADSFFEASQMRELVLAGDGEEIKARLQSLGITHVFLRSLDWKIRYPKPFLALLNDPRQALVRFHDGSGRLYELAFTNPDRKAVP